MRKIAIAFVHFYQKFISPVTVGSCRYYPSCSEYAIWQFETNGFFRAIISSLLRILRCNKLFPGGIEYPKVRFIPPKITPTVYILPEKIKYFFVQKNGYFVAIKSWDK